MVRKLHAKGWVVYQKYQGVRLSAAGRAQALQVLRRFLLWQVFLTDKLMMGWDEVQVMAEQLQCIQSPAFIQRLDDFLGHPAYSPHGKPIPNAQGVMGTRAGTVLTEAPAGSSGVVVAVRDKSTAFLQYLNKRGIYLGAHLTVIERVPFDDSMDVSIDRMPKVNISAKVSDNILMDLSDGDANLT